MVKVTSGFVQSRTPAPRDPCEPSQVTQVVHGANPQVRRVVTDPVGRHKGTQRLSEVRSHSRYIQDPFNRPSTQYRSKSSLPRSHLHSPTVILWGMTHTVPLEVQPLFLTTGTSHRRSGIPCAPPTSSGSPDGTERPRQRGDRIPPVTFPAGKHSLVLLTPSRPKPGTRGRTPTGPQSFRHR